MKLSACGAGAALALAVVLGAGAGEAQAARRGGGLPSYDVTSNCSLGQRGMALCLQANDHDRAFLRRVWAQTPSAVRGRCVGEVNANDPRPYAALAACIYPVVGYNYTRDQSFAYSDPEATDLQADRQTTRRALRVRRILCVPGEVFPLSGLCNQPGDHGGGFASNGGSNSGGGAIGGGNGGGSNNGGGSSSGGGGSGGGGTPSIPGGLPSGGTLTVTTTTISTEVHGRNGTISGNTTRSVNSTTISGNR